MDENKYADCVIFFCPQLGVGGLETYVFKHIKELLKKNVVIYWVCDKHKFIAPQFRTIINENNINISINGISNKDIRERLKDVQNPVINIISFHFDGFVFGEKLKRRLQWAIVNNLYLVGNFCGTSLYCEDAFRGRQKKRVYFLLKEAYQYIYNSKSLRFFSQSHIDEVERRYELGINVHNNEYLLKSLKEDLDFDPCQPKKLYERGLFNILSVSRLDFPHKGFIIGLIKTYGELKEKYPFLELTIIGDGEGMSRVKEEISLLHENARKGIHLIGTVSPDELYKYYRDANINISVAGCCTLGMKYGTLSVPARHYNYDCEVYGYLPEKYSFTTSVTPGIPCKDILTDVLNMSEDEYIERCTKCYETWQENDFGQTCDLYTSDYTKCMPVCLRIRVSLIYQTVLLKNRIKRVSNLIKQKGIIEVIHYFANKLAEK